METLTSHATRARLSIGGNRRAIPRQSPTPPNTAEPKGMQPDDESLLELYAGEWIATSQGKIIAHGTDFLEVAQEACSKASDFALRRAPQQTTPPRTTILMTQLPPLHDLIEHTSET